MSEFDGFGLLLTAIILWAYGGFGLYRMMVKDKIIEPNRKLAVIISLGGLVSLCIVAVVLWSD